MSTPSPAVPKADRPSQEGFGAAAWFLNCDVRAIQAVAEVESGPEGAFLSSGEPVILYERHLFRRLTEGEYDARVWEEAPRPEWGKLSAPTPGGYGPTSLQHAKLQAASKINREAALKSCSWGLFQILGLNHVQAGYPVLQRFINAMFRSADDHLRAFVMFIRADHRLEDALRLKDWFRFANTYNGSQQAKHDYSGRIASAYERLGTVA